MKNYFDVIIIGAGHAGVEAAYASAKIGASTVLLTSNIDNIAQMSCNPSIGGIAKGQVVREIDAMGGLMGRAAESSMISFRMLNYSKGPAVWSPRAQCDRLIYKYFIKHELEKTKNLYIKQCIVENFIFDNNEIIGINTDLNEKFISKAIVVCPGTFLNGKLHYGDKIFIGGRSGDLIKSNLSKSLYEQLNLKVGRLKTGTPQRILGKTIDFNKTIEQYSMTNDEYFTFYNDIEYNKIKTNNKKLSCFITKIDTRAIDFIKSNITKSPLYQGKIHGISTRYCPSIEDKIIKFPDKESHIIYLEPEGEYTDEYYINGLSTSLPIEIQNKIINLITGLENAYISRYGYAIEYDFIFPSQLNKNMSLKKYKNVFLAGQINGTSGYEEAAGQGLIAGINASKYVKNDTSFEVDRELCYIGVMIDDIINKDIIEPYRLFTSRSEYRIHLRQDCADIRLYDKAYNLGLLPESKYNKYLEYLSKLKNTLNLSKKTKHDNKSIFTIMKKFNGIYNEVDAEFLSKKINLNISKKIDKKIFNQIIIMSHYDGYLKKEIEDIKKLNSINKIKIPQNFDYKIIKGLGNESKSKLLKIRPNTLKQASRIDGITPVDLMLLRVFLKK